ncbi:hypothetical protein [Pseudomonas meliae]|uniref:N-acetyltransferase domain-containing protein n=1 Tax=Pseudomonas meliae TaxID=86176 RepID=A0A0P9V2F4_9PSED|nr:hypothetical protein [Pseudomonas meliae]KPX92082.1 Uncharacterized protein ALO64_03493 [Pseudomonas meliae]
MAFFDPIRDYFHRRQAKYLNELASRVHLVSRRQESQRGNFVFPGTDYLDDIQIAGQRVGYVSYGINPLNDRVYINKIEIELEHQRQGIGLGVLWRLQLTHQVPIVPLYQYGNSNGFWSLARQRLEGAGALIEDQLRTDTELDVEKQRWEHLVPELAHERKIREMMESPEWPEIEAGFMARQKL